MVYIAKIIMANQIIVVFVKRKLVHMIGRKMVHTIRDMNASIDLS